MFLMRMEERRLTTLILNLSDLCHKYNYWGFVCVLGINPFYIRVIESRLIDFVGFLVVLFS